MIAEPDHLIFRAGDRGDLLARMSRLAASRDGWVNIEPILPDGVEPPRPGVWAFLGFKGRDPLMATWMPGPAKGDGFEPTKVGLAHSAGHKAVVHLAEGGLPVPEGWRVVQDNAGRGVIAEVDDGADLGETVDWLLAAAERLATTPLTGRWRALFYRSV